MQINEIPFFVLLFLYIMPLTIGFLLLSRLVTILKTMISNIRNRVGISILVVGEMMVLLILIPVIMNIVVYIMGNQTAEFSIFQYLIVEMLPMTWYVILFYGIIANFNILYLRIRNRNKRGE